MAMGIDLVAGVSRLVAGIGPVTEPSFADLPQVVGGRQQASHDMAAGVGVAHDTVG
jgi:hypothetical protein